MARLSVFVGESRAMRMDVLDALRADLMAWAERVPQPSVPDWYELIKAAREIGVNPWNEAAAEREALARYLITVHEGTEDEFFKRLRDMGGLDSSRDAGAAD